MLLHQGVLFLTARHAKPGYCVKTVSMSGNQLNPIDIAFPPGLSRSEIAEHRDHIHREYIKPQI